MSQRPGRAFGPVVTPSRRLTTCLALAWKSSAIINHLPLDVSQVTCRPVAWHNHLKKIVLGIQAKVKAARKAWSTHVVIYGDCGTGNQLDSFLNGKNIARFPGPHCYHSFMGQTEFDAATGQELGTFFLTDCMFRHFERIVMTCIGLRDHANSRYSFLPTTIGL